MRVYLLWQKQLVVPYNPFLKKTYELLFLLKNIKIIERFKIKNMFKTIKILQTKSMLKTMKKSPLKSIEFSIDQYLKYINKFLKENDNNYNYNVDSLEFIISFFEYLKKYNHQELSDKKKYLYYLNEMETFYNSSYMFNKDILKADKLFLLSNQVLFSLIATQHLVEN